MISLSDLVTLAKAGWSPKAVKETIEMFQTIPEAKEAEIKSEGDKVEIKKEETPSPAPTPDNKSQEDDAIAKLKELLKEE
jgi:hypothetical protein